MGLRLCLRLVGEAFLKQWHLSWDLKGLKLHNLRNLELHSYYFFFENSVLFCISRIICLNHRMMQQISISFTMTINWILRAEMQRLCSLILMKWLTFTWVTFYMLAFTTFFFRKRNININIHINILIKELTCQFLCDAFKFN